MCARLAQTNHHAVTVNDRSTRIASDNAIVPKIFAIQRKSFDADRLRDVTSKISLPAPVELYALTAMPCAKSSGNPAFLPPNVDVLPLGCTDNALRTIAVSK
ncbi:MAG: hypothetical protein IPK95_13740 [Cellvibrionales bacterium]|nr:hypothetical protein [Cellvibrionales bacterium]